MKTKPILNEMTPYKPGKQIDEVKKEYGLDKIVKLASNENPFGFSGKVKEELPRMLESLEYYPDGHAREIRGAVSDFYQIGEDQLIFGNGSDEIVQILCRAFLEPLTNTVMAVPTFPQYKHNALLEGAEVREVALTEDGHHDTETMLNKVDDHTRILWLCSPNNPTGVLLGEEKLKEIIDRTPSHVLIVIDEAYYEYADKEKRASSLELVNNHKNVMVLRTFSKAYGLAGLRIGYGVGDPETISAMEPAREPFNTSVVAQKAAVLALEDQEFLEDTVAQTRENKKAFMDFCDSIDLRYDDSEANFVLIHLPISGDEMFEHLLTKGFIVRSGEALGIPGSIRLTIGSEEDMKKIQGYIEAKVKQEEKL
ncbi:histidinol-phosphate transaminase [Salimicrobium humidisoli]|uniref:Histidinol-phosphate aminotransferase n=1 Tax=Salimicrobium humidisoli TaxID=2029857 RepID=A0ABX4HRA2_9BACI|nr:histidinol-phosphate transaminase [Salimicrobium humidisoli]PBB05460.1 histidinol-phosphate transaminase [Salimicrobium humidisoli]